MAIEFLKKAAKKPLSGEEETVRIVKEILQTIESACEGKVMEYTKTLEKYSGNDKYFFANQFILSNN